MLLMLLLLLICLPIIIVLAAVVNVFQRQNIERMCVCVCWWVSVTLQQDGRHRNERAKELKKSKKRGVVNV